MTTRNLNGMYRRIINSNTRLQVLKQMHAPGIIVRNENRVLQDAISALLDVDEIAQLVDTVGAHDFVKYFNHVAGTGAALPVATAAPAFFAA